LADSCSELVLLESVSFSSVCQLRVKHIFLLNGMFMRDLVLISLLNQLETLHCVVPLHERTPKAMEDQVEITDCFVP
jgi:hypothetical protein